MTYSRTLIQTEFGTSTTANDVEAESANPEIKKLRPDPVAIFRFAYTGTRTQARRECTLRAAEFLRRYLQHVPPTGQHRVRYFGWLHPAARARLRQVETLLQKPIVVAAPPPAPLPWHLRCPHCAHFSLVRVGTLPRQARAPPRCTR